MTGNNKLRKLLNDFSDEEFSKIDYLVTEFNAQEIRVKRKQQWTVYPKNNNLKKVVDNNNG